MRTNRSPATQATRIALILASVPGENPIVHRESSSWVCQRQTRDGRWIQYKPRQLRIYGAGTYAAGPGMTVVCGGMLRVGDVVIMPGVA